MRKEIRPVLPLLLLAAAACDRPAEDTTQASPTETAASETIARTTEEGPVKALVELAPSKPKLGDPLTLTLTVTAEPGVKVELPAFGEALGRFSIMDFTPRQETLPDGTTVASQQYRLQAPMSGKQRIPQLRVEFIDERAGQSPDAGIADLKELLTESLTVEIESVLPDGDLASQLRPARGTLSEAIGPTKLQQYAPWGAAALFLLLLAFGIPALRRHLQARVRITAYDVAIKRLSALEARGMPSAEEADGWYVELSNIVRRYLEDRYGVRAPELTTEEFLREARQSQVVAAEHRDLLTSFLEGCDRVKFAAYRPEADESKGALATARRFLEETRLREGEPSTSPSTPTTTAEAH